MVRSFQTVIFMKLRDHNIITYHGILMNDNYGTRWRINWHYIRSIAAAMSLHMIGQSNVL